MRITNLSDSETARNTYEKDVEYSTRNPVLSTTIPQVKSDNPRNVLDKTTEDESLE